MKNILNMISSSFFRTLGRIIAYIGIVFLFFLFVSKFDIKGIIIPRLNAQVNDNNKITYNYLDHYVINNKTNSFFDSTGYLETIRNTLNQNSNTLNNAKYLIGFTQNDIIVFIDYNINSEFFMFSEVYTTFDRILINSNTISGLSSTNSSRYYYQLSDYVNLSSFINGILTHDNKKIEYTYSDYYRLAYTTNVDLRSTNYNWFNYNNAYFIPYATNTNLNNSCYGSGCSNSHLQSIPFIINGTSSYVPTYYNLYNSALPNSSLIPNSFKIYKEFFTINTSDLSTSWTLSTSFHYLLNNNSFLDTIKVYGLVNDSGLYHYEDITNQFILSGYTFSCNTGVKVCTFNIDNTDISYTGSLNNYSKIYFDIILTNFISTQKGSFSFNRSIPGIIDVGINDVSSSTLYLQLDSSSTNTYTFTTNNFNNTQIYYTNILENDFLYNMPCYIDLTTGDFNNEVSYVSSSYYYGTFNQVLFNNINLSSTTGIIMNLYNNGVDNIYNPTGSFQILYFITPNLYWSDSVYSVDRNSVNVIYDDNGSIISKDISGDFHNYNSQYSNVESQFNIIKGIMSEDMYGLSGLINTPLEKIKNLTTTTCSPILIPVPFTNNNLIIPCMSTIYSTYIPTIYNIWQVIILGIVSYYVGISLFRDIKNTLESDKNEIEVIEL